MDNSTNTMTRLKEFGAWSEQTSSSGKRYYYNQDTEVSQWEKPIEWKEHEKNLLEKYKSSKSLAKSGSQQQRPSTSGSGNGGGANITNNSNLVSGKYFASPTSTSLKLSSANNSFSTPQSSTSAQKTSLKRPREDDRQHHYHASKNSCLQTTPITAHQSACGSDGHHIQNNFSVASKTLGASVNNVTVSSHHRSSGNFNSRFSSTSSTLPFIQNGNSSVFVTPKVLTTGVSASTPNTNSAFGVQSFGGTIPTLSLNRNTVSPGAALGYQQHVPSSSAVKLQNNSSKSSSSRQSRVFNETSMKLCASTSARLTETTKMSSLHYTMASSTNNTSTSSSKFTTTQSGIDRSLSQQNTPTIAETSVPISNGKNLTTPSTLLRSVAMDPKQRQDQTPSSSTCQMSSSPTAKTREVPIFDEKKYLKFYRVELTLHRRNWSSDSYTSEARKFADRNTKQLATLSAVDDDIRSVYSLLKAAEMRCMLLSQKLSFVRQQISSLETKNPSSI